MRFTKMNGLGNDYIFIEASEIRQEIINKETIEFLCDRRFGVGSDGIVIMDETDSRTADAKMTIYNSDGSRAEICGNALRCFVKLLHKQNNRQRTFTIQTDAGNKTCVVNTDETISVNMGKETPVLTELKSSHGIKGYEMNVGNPHFVSIFYDKNERNRHFISLAQNISEDKSIFPNRTNVEFIVPISDRLIDMRVYERGSGETFACGTGATASFIVSHALGLTGNDASIRVKGGTLHLSIRADESVILTGKAAINYTGEITI